MEPMLDLEAKILDSYSSDTYAAKGLGCKLKSGTSGYDPSHWKRQLFLLTKAGELFMTSARSKVAVYLYTKMQVFLCKHTPEYVRAYAFAHFESALNLFLLAGGIAYTYF